MIYFIPEIFFYRSSYRAISRTCVTFVVAEVVLGCERTGSDNASYKRQNCRLLQQRTHEIIKKNCRLKNFVVCRTRPVGTLSAISINFAKG